MVGGFVAEPAAVERLASLGVRDSKTLSPERREEVYGRLTAVGALASVSLAPATIDRYVARGRLNDLEAETFAALVRRLAPDVAYVDACDPNARRFGRTVARLAGGRVRVVARHRADQDLPVVAAASIVAKVRRDRAIARLARALGTEVGSGYPSDPRTIAFARRAFVDGGPALVGVRRSWATVQRVKPRVPAPTLEAFAR